MGKTLFLPGAGGSRSFWQPVVERLGLHDDAILIGWPGFDGTPPDASITSLSDLPAYVLQHVDDLPPRKRGGPGRGGPFDLVAQSMGGVVAMTLALRTPERIRRLVLCATSGGIDLTSFDLEDWRPGYLRDMPESTPRWFVDDRTDLTPRLKAIAAPTLLIWGADDRIVPPAAGRMLAALLPNARIVIIPNTAHDVAQTHPDAVANHIAAFLDTPVNRPDSPLLARPVLSKVEGRGAVGEVTPLPQREARSLPPLSQKDAVCLPPLPQGEGWGEGSSNQTRSHLNSPLLARKRQEDVAAGPAHPLRRTPDSYGEALEGQTCFKPTELPSTQRSPLLARPVLSKVEGRGAGGEVPPFRVRGGGWGEGL